MTLNNNSIKSSAYDKLNYVLAKYSLLSKNILLSVHSPSLCCYPNCFVLKHLLSVLLNRFGQYAEYNSFCHSDIHRKDIYTTYKWRRTVPSGRSTHKHK